MELVEKLWAIEQIKQLKARYCRFTDTRQTEDFLGVFADDLVWTWLADDNVTVLKEIHGPGEFGAWLRSIEKNRLSGFSVHHCHMPEIEIVDENHAKGIWAVQDYLNNPGDKHFIGYGHYHEEYTRNAEGEWKISRCKLTRLHVDHFEDDPTFTQYASSSA
jgi:SnoaL-like protein